MQFPSSVIFTFGIRRLGLRFSRTVKEKSAKLPFLRKSVLRLKMFFYVSVQRTPAAFEFPGDFRL